MLQLEWSLINYIVMWKGMVSTKRHPGLHSQKMTVTWNVKDRDINGMPSGLWCYLKNSAMIVKSAVKKHAFECVLHYLVPMSLAVMLPKALNSFPGCK